MAAPVNKWRDFPNDGSADANTDTTAKRLAAIAGESPVSTTGGQEHEFGTIDISGGAADSDVINLVFDCDTNNSNSTISDMRIYTSNAGFTDAATVVKSQTLSGTDVGTPSNTENIANSAGTGDYTWVSLPESLPGAINSYSADDTATIDITTLGTTDDAMMWAMYLAVGASETPGTYLGTTSGFEFQISMRYTYS